MPLYRHLLQPANGATGRGIKLYLLQQAHVRPAPPRRRFSRLKQEAGPVEREGLARRSPLTLRMGRGVGGRHARIGESPR